MKKVIFGQELTDALRKSAETICGAVETTLGPKGNNVLIDSSFNPPFITNDGATIALNIESDNEIKNAILEIIKEASLKTDEEVGDGTTTTLTLLKPLLLKGLEEKENGANGALIKREMQAGLQKVLSKLKNLADAPTKSEFITVASNAANDKIIGDIVARVYFEVGTKSAIGLEESPNGKTYRKIQRGYSLELDGIPYKYLAQQRSIILKEARVLILNGYLDSLEVISDIVNNVFHEKRPLVILTEDYASGLDDELISFHEKETSIFILKLSDCGYRRFAIIEDICFITGATPKRVNCEPVDWKDVGETPTFFLCRSGFSLQVDKSKCESRIANLRKERELTPSAYNREFLDERIAKLSSGRATIYVGGATKTEIRERLMRFQDALCAIESAEKGIVSGEGLSFLEIRSCLEDDITGERILKEALLRPFQKICENAGENFELLLTKVVSENYREIFDFDTRSFLNVEDKSIIDPVAVPLTALKNAVSIATMLITLDYLVINEKKEYEKGEL